MVKATLNNQLEVMKHLVKLCNVNAKDEVRLHAYRSCLPVFY